MAAMELNGAVPPLFNKKTLESGAVASASLRFRPLIFVFANGTAVAPTES
jgi:hypothetical protein